MKLLAFDVETRPSLAYVWSLWNDNVPIERLVEHGEVMCWSAKWIGGGKTYFASDHHDDHDLMVQEAWGLFDEADVIVHYNGTKFDIPLMNREFVLAGLDPPAPYKQIDLYKAVRKRFRFVSNKLANVSVELGLEGKVKHDGFSLWKRCMDGEASAWDEMRRYNRQDVALVEQLYERIKPWIPNHPSYAAFESERCCPKCGGHDIQCRGFAITNQSSYQRWQCQSCGAWSRDTKAIERVDLVQVAD